MSHHWDEFSKSLAQPVPRRESLRRLGVAVAGAVLSPLGLGSAFARGGSKDPCKSICHCHRKSDQSQCLAACHDCQQFGGRLCGSCGNAYCADIENDPYNCGACGHECPPPAGQWEEGACIQGTCAYRCVPGTVSCNGVCTALNLDPENCGACGNVCPAATPYCTFGVCTECPADQVKCGGVCTNLAWDPNNCGACGLACPTGWSCLDGYCDPYGDTGGGGDYPPVNP